MRRGLILLAAILVLAAQPGPTSYDRTQDQRISALEAALAAPTASPSPAPTATAVPPPAGPVVRTISPATTIAAFQTLTADLSIDVIELGPGTYHWRAVSVNVDRTSRPLAIRGNGATFDASNDGDYGDAPFRVGGAHITFQNLRFQHYLLAQEGLFTFVGARFITLQRITVRNVAGNANASTEQAAHVLYVSRGSHDITADDFDVGAIQASDEPGGIHGLNGLHVYTGGTGSAVYNVTARRWIVDRANWAAVIRNGTTGVLIDAWTVTNSGHAVPAVMDFGSDNLGRVSNVSTSGSLAPPVLWGRMTDAGGSSWQ